MKTRPIRAVILAIILLTGGSGCSFPLQPFTEDEMAGGADAARSGGREMVNRFQRQGLCQGYISRRTACGGELKLLRYGTGTGFAYQIMVLNDQCRDAWEEHSTLARMRWIGPMTFLPYDCVVLKCEDTPEGKKAAIASFQYLKGYCAAPGSD